MNPSSSEIVSLFTRALACTTDAERATLLDQACGENRELRGQIESLLEAHRQARGFLEPKNVEETVIAASYVSGAVIGQRYKLLEEIAEGGMGTVWLAEQTHPVRRRVAVKLIKPGMDSRQVLSRFEAERQALAVMDHPHIAKVLDGGVTEQGRPYFVMEYVKGVPITQYCDQAKLNVEQRLKLMTQVCQAVQHAHQKGIIHRDLKPSNILVCLYDGQPVPKVIDFGLAKALHQSLTEATVLTSHGLMVGTPLYMSPEQAEFNNLDIDTRSDVYSLGVILYELLTGSTPLDKQRFKDAAIQEIIRLIKEEEPSKPSTKLSGSGQLPAIAAQRSLEPVQLSKLIRGDLDWIVMKALDKERSRRYETANGLAKDIERYLTDQPVEACPPSALYKFRKFARRNRLMLGAAGGIAAALIVGISVSTFLLFKALAAEADAELARSNEAALRIDAEKDRDEAVRQTEIANQAQANEKVALALAESRLADTERERDAARQQSQLALSMLTSVIGDVQQGLMGLPGSSEIRLRLLTTSLEKLEEVATEYVEQAEVDRHTLIALSEIGDVIRQFGVSEEQFGEVLLDEAETGQELSDEQQSAVEAARRFYLRAHEIALKLLADEPYDPMAQRDLMLINGNLGMVSVKLGDSAAARDYFLQYNALCEQLAAAYPEDAVAQRDVALSYNQLGDLYQRMGDTAAANDFFRQYNEHCARAAAIDPSSAEAQRDLSSSYEKLGDVSLRLGDLETARGYFEQSLEINQHLATADPDSAQAQRDLSVSYNWLGNVQFQLGDAQTALAFYQQSLDIRERLAAADPLNSEAQRDLSVAYDSLAALHLALGDVELARSFTLKSFEIAERLAAADPSNVLLQRDLLISMSQLGEESHMLGDYESARAYYMQVLAISEVMAARDPFNADAQRDLAITYYEVARVLMALCDFRGAIEKYRAAIEVLDEMIANGQYVEQSRQEQEEIKSELRDIEPEAENAILALEEWDTFISLPDAHSRLRFRIALLSIAERFDEIPQSAAMLRSLDAENPGNLYVAATGYAACAEAIEPGEGESLTPEQQALRQEYIDLALACLSESIAAGFNDFEYMRQDPERNSLRGIPEFEELISARPDGKLTDSEGVLADWETFIRRPGARAQLAERILQLAAAGRFDEIPQSAAMLRSLDAENLDNLYNAACGYAVCAGAIVAAEGESLSEEQQMQRQEYIDLALACLRESIAAGYSDFEHMQQDPDLAVLRDLPELEELLGSSMTTDAIRE